MQRSLPLPPVLGLVPGALVLAVLLLGGPGCVLRYEGAAVRPAEPLPPPVDFVEVEARLEDLRESETDVDVRDRIDAALDLLRAGRTMPPAPQAVVLRYLQRVIAVEERDQPMEAPALLAPPEQGGGSLIGPPIEEEDLGGSQVLEPEPPTELPSETPAESLLSPDSSPLPDMVPPDSAGALPEGRGDPVERARAALDAGDPAGALAALEPCPRIDCGPEADELAALATDAWIHAERERAGDMFVQAREVTDPIERRARMEEVGSILTALVERFPDYSEVDDIRRNIETVATELAEQAPAP